MSAPDRLADPDRATPAGEPPGEEVLDRARVHLLDRLYAWTKRGPPFFSLGWGDDAELAHLSTLLPPPDAPRPVALEWTGPARRQGDCEVRDGSFDTPFPRELLPVESHRAHVRLVSPPGGPGAARGVCVHLASTGDQGFARRWPIARALAAEHGLASVLLENPYYGQRRPAGQTEVRLHRVRDLMAMGIAAIEEGRSLLAWLRGRVHDAVGITGLSMGGHTAALAGVRTPFPLALVPCIPVGSAVPVFTEGLLADLIAWDRLGHERGGDEAARARMREVLAFTDVRLLPPPVRPDATIVVAAARDGYAPTHSAASMHAHWRDAEIRMVPGGHVAAFVRRRNEFVRAIDDAFRRLATAGAPARSVAALGGGAPRGTRSSRDRGRGRSPGENPAG